MLCVLWVCARACERMISFHFKEAHFEQSKTTDSTQLTTTTREKERKNERTKKQMSIPREWSENRSLNVVFSFFRLCFFNRCMHIWTHEFVECSAFSTVPFDFDNTRESPTFTNHTQTKKMTMIVTTYLWLEYALGSTSFCWLSENWIWFDFIGFVWCGERSGFLLI